MSPRLAQEVPPDGAPGVGAYSDQPDPEPPDSISISPAIDAAIHSWTHELVDLGGRNRLLYFKQSAAGLIDLGPQSAADPLEVEALLGGAEVRLSQLFLEPDALREAARRGRNIQRRAREHEEEQGIRTLYVGWGMAAWTRSDPGPEPLAPILLAAAELEAHGRIADDFTLRIVDDWEINLSLVEALRRGFGVDWDPDAEGDLEFTDLDAACARLLEVCGEVPGFELRRAELVLSTFSFTKLPLLRDLEQAAEAVASHDLVAALAGDGQAASALGGHYLPVDSSEYRADLPPQDEFLVLDADSTQSGVINAAAAGHHLVIEGPPGTGKSQTIANLIATFAARGKSVLFVAEKRAAIDAVTKRLKSVGLGELVLDLHEGTRSRRQTIRQLATALDHAHSAPFVESSEPARRLSQLRGELDAVAEEQHRRAEPWQLSLFEVRGQMLEMPAASQTEVRIARETLPQLHGETFRGALDDLAEYVRRCREADQPQHPWYEAFRQDTLSSAETVRDVLEDLNAAAHRLLPRLRSELDGLAGRMGAEPPSDLSEARVLIERAEADAAILGLADHARSFFRDEFIDELDPVELRRLIADAQPLRGGFFSRLLSSSARRARRVLAERLANDRTAPLAALDYLEQIERGIACREQLPPQTNQIAAAPASEALNELRAALDRLAAPTCLPPTDNLPLDELARRLAALDRERDAARQLPRIQELRQRLQAQNLHLFIQPDFWADDPPEVVRERMRYAWLSALHEYLLSESPAVSEFNADAHRAAVATYRAADIDWIAQTSSRIRRRWGEAVLAARNEWLDESDLIVREARKKSRHLSLRELMRRAPHVLTALKPCWAMSPLVVSQLLPGGEPRFDLIVFDEASQIPPADAVPALLRGRQVIVAGDANQLPPTAFFTQRGEDEGEADEEEWEDALLTNDVESILDAVSTLLHGPRGSLTLGWHYRSQDERLIAFANQHVYHGAMYTFPGQLPGDCITHVEVPFSARAVAQSGSNQAEVERVVELILEHAAARPQESLGVIALGSQHALRIEETLRLARRARPELDDFFARRPAHHPDEPFFVKNLERVQGDERDAIMLTVGYGRRADGGMRYIFGPINMAGGYRRLNVAITRAKRRMTLISAFSHTDMDPKRLNSRGPQMLRDYIAYAASGGRELGSRSVDKPALNAFERDIARQLERLGIAYEAQYGSSGYLIDFAAMHPEQPGRPVLAIEADGASYHSSPSARERDRLRQDHLERLGWRFHRIWSTEWFNRRETEVERIRAAWQAAVDATDRADAQAAAAAANPPAPPEPEPAAPEPPPEPPRKLSRPQVWEDVPITEYSERELDNFVQWAQSDGLLHTDETIIRTIAAAMGYRRVGKRITRTLQAAIDRSRHQKRQA